MDEFTCEKCRARLAVFEEESRLKCTCGAEYEVDRSKSPIQLQRSECVQDKKPKEEPKTEAIKEEAAGSKENLIVGPDWERFYDEDVTLKDGDYRLGWTLCLFRARIPGGWLVYSMAKEAMLADKKFTRPIGMTFVPDPSRGWDGTSPW